MSSRTDPKATHTPAELEAIASSSAPPLGVEGSRDRLLDGASGGLEADRDSSAPSEPSGSSADGAGAEDEGAPPSVASARIQVRREERLDLVLEYLAFVAKPMPLSLLLDEAPQRIAAILGADVASLYLLEGDGDELVLRGNVGFPREARGTVRLPVGQGITGMAVECLRPISVVQATEHERYRAFPELREERFPVFLAAPILGSGRPLGALVVQRAGDRAFTARDVELLMALTAPIAAGARHAQVLDELRERRRRTGGGTRKVTLPGLPVVPGRALGAIAALRRPASSSLGSQQGRGDPKLLRFAFDTAEKALVDLHARAAERGIAQDAAFLSTYLLMIGDGRLRARAFELAAGGRSVAQALGTVAREVARAANGIVGDPFLQDRARDIEDLCDAILMLATPDARAQLPSKAVLVGDQLTVFDLLISARANPVGVVLSDRSGPRSLVLLQLLGVPSIVDVAGAFRWASPGDVALLDADHGFLVINPSRAEVATVRAARRKGRPSLEPGSEPDDDGEDEPAG
ncbi:GAF domain-containing protein [Sorangium sp. So ce233]|uniref:GAF domain-containing protein n=1 Tax=Sorangium sp. So ce233 TaxID=3133290 RepID=UPI003F6010D2